MARMTTDWITDADHIRDTLDKHGPLTRDDLADKTDLPRATLAKSLYALKKQGDVIEEGDRLMLTKATESALDAPEPQVIGNPTSPANEYVTEPPSVIPPTVHTLPELAESSLAALITDYQRLYQEWQIMNLRVANIDQLLNDQKAYHALKARVRGLLDD
jgi:hypothetical protein